MEVPMDAKHRMLGLFFSLLTLVALYRATGEFAWVGAAAGFFGLLFALVDAIIEAMKKEK